MSILSFMLFPEGYEVHNQALECFFETAPKGLTVKVEIEMGLQCDPLCIHWLCTR